MYSKTFMLSLTALFLIASCNTPEKTEENVTSSQSESIPLGDNSRVSLDWDGVYTGTVPCADCEGIKTMIKLNKDNTYEIKTRYLGKSEEVYTGTGTFTWNEDGGKITLEPEADGIARSYLVGENILFHLDNDGNRITGDMADKYQLSKIQKGLEGKRWKLVELMGKEVSDMGNNQGKTPFLMFTQEGNKLTGNLGCNSVVGTYELGEGNRLSFAENLAVTMMACVDMTIEDQFKEVLGRVDNYTLNEDGTVLSLNRAKMAPLARLEVDYMD